VWWWRERRAIAYLLALTGLIWLAGTIWPSLEFLHRGVLLHLLASYPAGRLACPARTMPDRLRLGLVAAGYATTLTRLGGNPIVAAAWGSTMLWCAWDTYGRTAGTARRAGHVAAAGASAVGLTVLAGAALRLIGVAPGVMGLAATEAVLAVTGLGLAVDLLLGRWPDAALTQAIIDLGQGGMAGSIRERLARLLGDPSLKLAFAVDARSDTFVDETGQPAAITPNARHAVAPMLLSGQQVGIIAYDASVLDDPHLVDAVSSAAALAMANASLQAAVLNRVQEVRASRERLVLAADAERRRLERRLQRGPVRRLERAGQLLAATELAGGKAAACRSLVLDLEQARRELIDFALGVHPASLTASGLTAALAELARRVPIPVKVEADVARAEPITDATLYFVCSEALANAAKHARASKLTVRLRQTDAATVLTVTDDGQGRARLVRGGGLAGLADRLEALGGTLRVQSRPGSGTIITAELPRRAGEGPLGGVVHASSVATGRVG
jgi:signal transduction histidine kinase